MGDDSASRRVQRWRENMPYMVHAAEQMNTGLDHAQRMNESVSSNGSPMSFQLFYANSPDRDVEMPDISPVQPTSHEPVAPVFEEEPVPGRAILQGYEAQNERVQQLLSELSKNAIQAVHTEINSLSESHRPPNFDPNTVLNVPGPNIEGGSGLISPPPLLGYGSEKSVAITKRPARRVVDFDDPPAPLEARKKRKDPEKYDKFDEALRVYDPPPPMPKRNNEADSDEDENEEPIDISAPVQNPGPDEKMTKARLPFTLSLHGVEKLTGENMCSWPVPKYAPRNDMGYSYLLLVKVIEHLTAKQTAQPYKYQDFERVLTETQMVRLKRWIRIPGDEWSHSDDVELFELVRKYGTSERGWMAIGAEMRMFYCREAYDRYQEKKGFKPYLQQLWTKDEDQNLYDTFVSPDVGQNIYEIHAIENPVRSRRSTLRRLDLILQVATGNGGFLERAEDAEEELPDSYEESDESTERARPTTRRGQASASASASTRAGPSRAGPITRRVEADDGAGGGGGSSRDGPSSTSVEEVREENENKRMRLNNYKPDRRQIRSPERVRQAYDAMTNRRHAKRLPIQGTKRATSNKAASFSPFTKDTVNLLWELHRWDFSEEEEKDERNWDSIARRMNVVHDKPGEFVRHWYYKLGLDRTRMFPLAWTNREDSVLQLSYQETPGQWSNIAEKLPRRSEISCQRRLFILDRQNRSPTDGI